MALALLYGMIMSLWTLRVRGLEVPSKLLNCLHCHPISKTMAFEKGIKAFSFMGGQGLIFLIGKRA